MYRRIVSELAHEDLYNIIKYIKSILCAPKAASDFADDVRRCYARLENNPLMYALCDDERLANEGYRKALIKNYVLVYKVDEERKTVNIYRFFFGAEDYFSKI